MSKDFQAFKWTRILKIYVRASAILVKTHFVLYLILLLINPLVMFSIRRILEKNYPKFRGLNLSDIIPYEKVTLVYAPEDPILTNMFNSCYSDVKGYNNVTRLAPINKNWQLNHESDRTYLQYEIFNFSLENNVDVSKLTHYEKSKNKYFVSKLSYSSNIFHYYDSDMGLDVNGKSIYLSTIYVIKSCMYSMLKSRNVSYPFVLICGLPYTLHFENVWPSMQMMFFYFMGGAIILQMKTLKRLSEGSVLQMKGVNSILNYIVVGSMALIAMGLSLFLTCLILAYPTIRLRLVKIFSWYILQFGFYINILTLILFSMTMCEFNMSTYSILYFLTIIMTPQILYVFAFGVSNANNCMFQYVSSISPLFLVGWSLVTIEDTETNARYSEPTYSLMENFQRECYSYITAILFQLGHILINILFIIYCNFFTNSFSYREIIRKHRRRHKLSERANYSERWASRHHNKSVSKRHSLVSEKSRKSSSYLANVDIVISMNKICKTFKTTLDEKLALKNVSIRFCRNKVTTILGPNGSGKTTILKLLSGKYALTSGSIYLDGRNISNNAKELQMFIYGYFEDFKFLYFLSVMEYFELVIHQNHSKNWHNLHNLLNQFVVICDLDNVRHKSIEDCPESTRKVIKIISTFLTDKPVILMDDPLTGFDHRTMLNVAALFNHQKKVKTIILTSCDTNTVEYITDIVVVLINGRKVSETKTEDFNMAQIYYKLICCMEAEISDYTLTRFINQNFPKIIYDYSCDNVSFFSIPKLSSEELWSLLNSIEENSEKLGIWRYKLAPLGMRHYLSYIFDAYLRKHNINSLIYSCVDVLPENIRESFTIYKRHFIMIFSQRLTGYYRFPVQLIMRYLLPVLVFLIWVVSTGYSHKTIIYLNNGFDQKSYSDEINTNNKFYMGCAGTTEQCFGIFQQVWAETSFISKSEQYEYRSHEDGFSTFQNLLYKFGEDNFPQYNNDTLFALFFEFKNGTVNKCYMYGNDYKSRIFATQVANEVLMSPRSITLKSLILDELLFAENFVEINYLLRLMMFLLLAFSITNHRNISHSVNQRFYALHKLAGVHYSLLYVPHYLLDLFLYWLLLCFMLLLVYIMDDHNFTLIRFKTYSLVSGFLLFVMADLSLKLLVNSLSNFNPVYSYFLNCIDMLLILGSNSSYYSEFIIKQRTLSFTLELRPYRIYAELETLTKFISPTVALNSGIMDMQIDSQALSNANGVLFLQGIIYFGLVFLYEALRNDFRFLLNKFKQCAKKKKLMTQIEINKKKKSFLFLKGISLFKKDHLYFENINIELKPGSVWGILGPNNSGKTDLINIILGNVSPTTGGVYLNSKLIKTLYNKHKAVKVGYCSEELFYLPDLTMEEIMVYWGRIKLLPENMLFKSIYEILRILLLATDLKTVVKDLTNTTIKKLNIAIAMLGYPEIIILDDPFSNLDSLSTQGVMHLIHRAKINNCTVLLTGSEIANVRHILSHIVVLDDYSVKFQGRISSAILNHMLGYYLTVFIKFPIGFIEEYEETLYLMELRERLLKALSSQLMNVSIYNHYEKRIVYFLPFQSKNDPNSTKLILILEKLKSEFHIGSYIIKYDMFFSPKY